MSRLELDRQLEELRTAVLQMGEGVVAAIDQAIEALTHQDQRALDAVIAGDDTIDRACAAIEDLSARVITLQQPAVRDLRAVLAALARVQLQGALDAYCAGDATRARDVWGRDGAMDSLHNQFVHALLSRMRSDQEKVVKDTYLLWVSHNLERIADRATNICERVVFIATGERIV